MNNLRNRALKFSCLLLLPLGLLWHPSAHASGDCSDENAAFYTPIDQSYSQSMDCRSSAISMAMLSPGNDTRVNLMLLMADLHGVPEAAKASSDDPPQFGFHSFRGLLFPAAPGTEANYRDRWPYLFPETPAGTCPHQDALDTFKAAVMSETTLPPNERELLIAKHRSIANCSDDEVDIVKQIQSDIGEAYLDYLLAAWSFYLDEYQQAIEGFTQLATAPSPWVRETALYMVARSAVRATQEGAFDEYGNPERDWSADSERVAAALAALDAYLDAYPRGRYANSARGLIRRVHWFAGGNLAAAYSEAIAQNRALRNLDDGELAQEIDVKLLFPSPGSAPYETSGAQTLPIDTANPLRLTLDPLLLATMDLYRMRQAPPGTEGYSRSEPFTREMLLAQREYFDSNKPLFDFLLATHAFYVEHQFDEVLTLIPADTKQAKLSYLQFSRQLLRGLAMQKQQNENAREHYVSLVPSAVLPAQRSALELSIALIDEENRQVARIFADDSLVRNQAIRNLALSQYADAPLLRRQANDTRASIIERETALFVLLYKQLTRGFYADYLRDLPLIPESARTKPDTEGNSYVSFSPLGAAPLYAYSPPQTDRFRQPLWEFSNPTKPDNTFTCPALQNIATTLAGNENDVRAKLCLAEFIRLKYLDEFVLDAARADGTSDSRSLFPGNPYSRLTIYRSVIADPKASADDKAYALFRAVWCYGPNGNNSCGGEEVPLTQRRDWFRQLKRDYPKSEWAQTLKYYW